MMLGEHWSHILAENLLPIGDRTCTTSHIMSCSMPWTYLQINTTVIRRLLKISQYYGWKLQFSFFFCLLCCYCMCCNSPYKFLNWKWNVGFHGQIFCAENFFQDWRLWLVVWSLSVGDKKHLQWHLEVEFWPTARECLWWNQ